ncbi:MAG TPA: protein TolR [Burkholderiales bacterium]|nr:protein TolR [Burkholderiales bacterium]
MNQINVVPYIDVMLVLLIIFMITAPLITPGQIELPSVGKTQDTPMQPVEIQIKANGKLMMRDTAKQSTAQSVNREELIAIIREKQGLNPDQPVVIAADKAVKYEEVMKIMDVLQENQVKRIGLLAKPKSS